MSHIINLADDFPRTATQAVGGIMPNGTTSYTDADGSYKASVTLPSAIGRRNEILTVTHNATLDAVLQGTNKSPATALTLSAANRVTRWISDGATWRAVEDSKAGGNILAKVSNVAPIAVLPVGDLFEASMPPNTDVRIRALVNRQVYLTSEGEYPGGSFTTSTAAIVNLTTTFVPADNNVHVNGELNRITIQDISSGRLFVVTVWRLAGIGGNWSGWVEEIGVTYAASALPPEDFFRSTNALPDGTNDLTKPIYHSGFVGVGLAANPICPLEFGDPVRNDVIRIWDAGAIDPHQFYGFGVNGGILRYQVDKLASSHVFFGGASATASKQYGRIADRNLTIGDPAAPIQEGHWMIGTEGVADNGYIQFRSPNAAPGTNKVQAQIFCDGYGGFAGISGSTFDIQTAANTPNSPLLSRLLIDSAGNVVVSGTAFKPGGGTWAATSDIRTKKNIKALISGLTGTTPWLDKVLKLTPVEFEYNGLAGTQAGTVYTGFIAQDVQKIFPAWIMESMEKIDNAPVLQIDSSPLIYALLECVRELKAEIDKLKGVTPPQAASSSLNKTRVNRLLLMGEAELGAIGFTPTQTKTFVAGSNAVKLAISSGMTEAEILKTLSALLSSIGLTLTGVMGQL